MSLENRDILVSIASYCDKELRRTVEDLLNKCSDPSRLDIIIINQSDYPEYLPYENVTEVFIYHTKCRGVSWARSHINSYVNKYHKYFLQIDAHMRFYQDWDLTFIKNLNNDKEVISTFPYPHDYDPSNKEDEGYRPLSTNRFVHKSGDGSLFFKGGPVPDELSLIPSSISAAQIFSHINFLKDVPIDSRMSWTHEQSDLTIRAHLKGYTIKSIEHPPAVHMYGVVHARHFRDGNSDLIVTEEPVYEDDVNTMESFEVLHGINYDLGIKEAMKTVLLNTVDSQDPWPLFWDNHRYQYGFTAYRKTIDKVQTLATFLQSIEEEPEDQIIEILDSNFIHCKRHNKIRPLPGEIVTNDKGNTIIGRAATLRKLLTGVQNIDNILDICNEKSIKVRIRQLDHIKQVR